MHFVEEAAFHVGDGNIERPRDLAQRALRNVSDRLPRHARERGDVVQGVRSALGHVERTRVRGRE